MSRFFVRRRHLSAASLADSEISGAKDSGHFTPCSAEHLRCMALNLERLNSRHASINFALSDPSALVRLEAARRLTIRWTEMFDKGLFDKVIEDIKYKSCNPLLYFNVREPRLNPHIISNPKIAVQNYRLSVLMALQNIFRDSDAAFSRAMALSLRHNNFLESVSDKDGLLKTAFCLKTNPGFFPEINKNSDNPFENIFSIVKTAIVSQILSDCVLRRKFFNQITDSPDLSRYQPRNNGIIIMTQMIISCMKQVFEQDQNYSKSLSEFCQDGYLDY